MKIKLLPQQIMSNIRSEDELLDNGSVMESIYVIRKLKAALYFGTADISVSQKNSFDQVFVAAFDIWFSKDEYVQQK